MTLEQIEANRSANEVINALTKAAGTYDIGRDKFIGRAADFSWERAKEVQVGWMLER